MQTQVLQRTRRFKLVKQMSPKKKKPVYMISCDTWFMTLDEERSVRQMLDPNNNKRNQSSLRWRFLNRARAESAFTMLCLMFPG